MERHLFRIDELTCHAEGGVAEEELEGGSGFGIAIGIEAQPRLSGGGPVSVVSSGQALLL